MGTKWTLLLGGLIFVWLWALIFYENYGDWRNHEKLVHSGVQTVGTVTAKEPLNHLSIRYDYLASSSRFSGMGASRSQSEFDKIQIGDQIPVTYLPDHPAISAPGDASELYHTLSGILFVILPFCVLLMAGVTAFYVRTRFPHKVFL